MAKRFISKIVDYLRSKREKPSETPAIQTHSEPMPILNESERIIYDKIISSGSFARYSTDTHVEMARVATRGQSGVIVVDQNLAGALVVKGSSHVPTDQVTKKAALVSTLGFIPKTSYELFHFVTPMILFNCPPEFLSIFTVAVLTHIGEILNIETPTIVIMERYLHKGDALQEYKFRWARFFDEERVNSIMSQFANLVEAHSK